MPELDEILMAGITPEDTEREKEIYARLFRGPRERAKEIEAEIYKSRYGLTPESGKMKKLTAALGEFSRAFQKDYQSPYDIAQAQGQKEYAVEVGPLQRELGAMTQARSAAARVAAQYANNEQKNEIARWEQGRKQGLTDAQIAQMNMWGPAKLEEIKARANLLHEQALNTDARTTGQNLKNDDFMATGGMTGEYGNVARLNNMDPASASRFANILTGLKQALNPRLGTSQTMQSVTSTGQQAIPGDAGKVTMVETQRTSPRMITTQDPALAERRRQGILQNIFQQPAPDSRGTPAPPLAQGGGNPIAQALEPEPPQSPVFSGGQYRKPLTRSVINDLAQTWGMKPEEFKGFSSPRYENIIGIRRGIGKTTADDRAESEYNIAIADLSNKVIPEYGKTKLKDTSGLWNNFVAKLKSSAPDIFGALPPEALTIRGGGINTMAQYILKLSGKAVTEKEAERLSGFLPNVAADAPETFLTKTLMLSAISNRRQFQKRAGISDDEMAELLQTSAGQQLSNAAENAAKTIMAIDTARRNGRSDIDGISLKVLEDRAKYRLSTQYIREKMKEAVKQSNRTDFIPVR